jgi:hypothetical protein
MEGPAVNEVGLTMVVDPRWIVAVPENDDVAAEVARQLGEAPDGADGRHWVHLVEGVGELLRRSLDDGARWCGVWLATDATDDIVLTRAELRTLELSGPVTPEALAEELTVVHRDDEYVAELALVETLLGPAVRSRQVVAAGDDAHEVARYIWPREGHPLVLEAHCSRAGWLGLWGAQLEAMAQTIRPGADVPVGRLQMVEYVLGDEAVPS